MKLSNFFKRDKTERKDGFLESVECGQFTLDFYYDEENTENCKVEIHCGVQMDVILNATHEGYGFLLSCRQDGAKDAMEAYCGILWQCSYLLAMDSYFPKRVNQSWQKYMRGLDKQAKAAAEAITDEQNEANEALMSEAVKVSQMSGDEKIEMGKRIIEDLNKKVKNDG